MFVDFIDCYAHKLFIYLNLALKKCCARHIDRYRHVPGLGVNGSCRSCLAVHVYGPGDRYTTHDQKLQVQVPPERAPAAQWPKGGEGALRCIATPPTDAAYAESDQAGDRGLWGWIRSTPLNNGKTNCDDKGLVIWVGGGEGAWSSFFTKGNEWFCFFASILWIQTRWRVEK